MSDLTQSSLLTRGIIDEQRYVESLLSAAEQLGMIDAAFTARFHQSFQSLLIRQCRAFAGGSGSSIRRETAERLAGSILFTLSAQLGQFEPLDALAILQNGSIDECYLNGRQRVDRLVQATELAWRAELRHPLPVENALLRDTLCDGIMGFFKLYNPEYGAQEIHITADYPALFRPQGWMGIEFIRRYLDNMIMENRFLRLLETAPLHRCLNLYALRNQTTLNELCDNLFEIALACALLPLLPPEPCANQLPAAACQLMTRLECKSPALREYIARVCVEYGTDLLRIQQLMAAG